MIAPAAGHARSAAIIEARQRPGIEARRAQVAEQDEGIRSADG
jgi:hypothetical protein